MERVIHSAVHNRFDIEVTDYKTGKMKQKVTSFNIILDNFFTRLINCDAKLTYIHLGTGYGEPAITDTSLFKYLGAKVAEVDEVVKAHPTSYIRKKIVLAPAEYAGETITEVGFGFSNYASSLVTHSMLKDSEGNQIVIEKKDTDVVTIYATFYVTIGDAVPGVYVLPTPKNNAIIKAVLEDKYQSNSEPIDVQLGMSNNIETADELAHSAIHSKKAVDIVGDLENKRWNIPTTRWDYSEANGYMISAVGSPSIAAWILPNNDLLPNIRLTDVAVGTGDGATTQFNTPVPRIVENSEQIRVDGVLQIKGQDYTIEYSNNGKEWPEFFESADPTKVSLSEGVISDYSRYPYFTWGKHERANTNLMDDYPITLEFHEPTAINLLVINEGCFSANFYSYSGQPRITITLDYSTDGQTWQNAFTSENTYANEIVTREWFDPPIVATYWRLSSSYHKSYGPSSLKNIQLGYVVPGLTFTVPPAQGAAVDMDFSIDRPIKNENWILDFGFSVQFERG